MRVFATDGCKTGANSDAMLVDDVFASTNTSMYFGEWATATRSTVTYVGLRYFSHTGSKTE